MKGAYSTNFCFYLAWYSYHNVGIDFGMQKTDKFIINGMAVQSEVRDTYLLTAEMFARQISGLSGHGMHSAYSCTPAGATYEFLLGRQIFLAPKMAYLHWMMGSTKLQTFGGRHWLTKYCGKKILWKSMLATTNFWLLTFYKKIFFCVQQKKKLNTGLEQLLRVRGWSEIPSTHYYLCFGHCFCLYGQRKSNQKIQSKRWEYIIKLIGLALCIKTNCPICRMQSQNFTKFGMNRKLDSLRVYTELGQILPIGGATNENNPYISTVVWSIKSICIFLGK